MTENTRTNHAPKTTKNPPQPRVSRLDIFTEKIRKKLKTITRPSPGIRRGKTRAMAPLYHVQRSKPSSAVGRGRCTLRNTYGGSHAADTRVRTTYVRCTVIMYRCAATSFVFSRLLVLRQVSVKRIPRSEGDESTR